MFTQNKNFLLAGVGGQGTVLASRLLAQVAIDNGFSASTAETIGMAQRGGCVVSHVRTSSNESVTEVLSPLIPFGKADVILGFEPAEAVRALPYLKRGGAVVVSKAAIMPITASLENASYDGEEMLMFLGQNVKRLTVVDGAQICKECGSSKVLNVALLGAAVGCNALPITVQVMKETIKNRVPPKFVELNLKAFELGYMGALV